MNSTLTHWMHKPRIEMSYRWKAPATDVGPVKFV